MQILINKKCNKLPESFIRALELSLIGTEDAEKYLTSVEGLEVSRRLAGMRRAGHRIYFVRLDGQALVVKFFADFGDSRFGRRLEFRLKNLVSNFAVKSYQGALLLHQVGIPAIEPLACITQPSLLNRKGVFVYREVDANSTLGEWFAAHKDDSRRESVFMAVADIIRRMYASGVYQPDLVKSNILFRNEAEGFRLFLIDTDDVRRLPVWLPKVVKKYIFAWSLRRMRVPDEYFEIFFSRCFDQDFSNNLAAWIRFVQNNKINPIKTLKRSMRKKKCK
ncbi:lipopolysaccharide kinase InaA family protein [Marinospirillum sp.]|uniref:lipopolysaccharide kinase InaA family protein n=1 Tax=Marinospirillum sp. TaxID=2183934 RepID=UPI00384B5711